MAIANDFSQIHPRERKFTRIFFIFERQHFKYQSLNTIQMRKTILAIAFMLVAMVSCQDKTKDKIEDAKEAVGAEVEQKMDTVAKKVETAIDSTQSKTGKVLEKGAEKLDKAAEGLKEAAKK